MIGSLAMRTGAPAPRRLREITGELERGVFLAVYRSRAQRRRRAVAVAILSLKHGLRGMLFTWPLYLLAWGAPYLPGGLGLLVLALVLPGLAVSLLILRRAVHEDYARMVRDVLLEDRYPGRLVRG